MAYINFASDEQMGKFHELVDMFESGEIDKGTFLYEASTLIGDISVSGYESGFKAVWDCHEVWKKEKSQKSYDEGFDAGAAAQCEVNDAALNESYDKGFDDGYESGKRDAFDRDPHGVCHMFGIV